MAIIFNNSESFASMCKRQAVGLNQVNAEMAQDDREQEEISELQKKSFERKKKLLYDNLDLIMRHKEEIYASPRYANIDVHYAIKGGGLYIGQALTSRVFNITGSPVRINLRLASLLKVWDTDQFRVDCKCGSTAFIRSFTGSPLSGCSQATAYCPECKNEPHVGNRSFGNYYGNLTTIFSEDVEAFAKSLIAKWTLAEVEYKKKVDEGKFSRWSRIGAEFHGDGTPCNLETMINELRLKEFEESVYTQRTGNDNICHNI